MATFISDTKEQAESKLRDFPMNWTLVRNTGKSQDYLCNDDASIFACVDQQGRNCFITIIDLIANA